MIDGEDIRITKADDTGYGIWIASRLVAALTTRAEVAEWIERHLGTPEIIEREQQEIADVREQYPRVVGAPRTNPRRPWFKGG